MVLSLLLLLLRCLLSLSLVILSHILIVLGVLKVLQRVALHEGSGVGDVVGCVSWVCLSTLGVIVDVSLHPGFVLGFQGRSVEIYPVFPEILPVSSVLG